MRAYRIFLILFFIELNSICGESLKFDLSPTDIRAGYTGIIREDEYAVHLTPSIRIIKSRDIQICSYKISASVDIPFHIHIKNRYNGLASIVATNKLNCENVKEYFFNISAVSCNGNISNFAPVHIRILDVNEYEPQFNRQVYNVEVEEGKLYKEIIKLQAYDKDCSFDYSSICNYLIINNNGNQYPFAISNDGIVSNTKFLDWNKGKNFILEVVAEDCGEKQSKPVLININVIKACTSKWENVDQFQNYSPINDILKLTSKTEIKLCESTCQIDRIVTTFTLSSGNDVGKGCDRGEAENITTLERLRPCLGPDPAEDLLKPAGGTPAGYTEPRWDGTSVLDFDGLNDFVPLDGYRAMYGRYKLPDPALPNDIDGGASAIAAQKSDDYEGEPVHHYGKKFGFGFWMRHGSDMEAAKEHIYCRADGRTHNRHHLSLFVKNCRLVLLVRQEYTVGQHRPPYNYDAAGDPHHSLPRNARKKMFKPSEIRWKLPEVCDGAWHHYVINVDFPRRFELMIDGKIFKNHHTGFDREQNPEVADDWPLHPIGETGGQATVSSVGACWEGKNLKMSHFFRGQISDLILVRHRTITRLQAQCIVECRETLTVNRPVTSDSGKLPPIPEQGVAEKGMSDSYEDKGHEEEVIYLPPDSRAPYNGSFEPSRVLTLQTGSDPMAAQNLVRNVGYINSALQPLPGLRNIKVQSYLICKTDSVADPTTGDHRTIGATISSRDHVIQLSPLQIQLMVHQNMAWVSLESIPLPTTGSILTTKLVMDNKSNGPIINNGPLSSPLLHLAWDTNSDKAPTTDKNETEEGREAEKEDTIDVTIFQPGKDSGDTLSRDSGGIKLFERVSLRVLPPDYVATDRFPSLVIYSCVITSPGLSAGLKGNASDGKFVLPANLITALTLEFEESQVDLPEPNDSNASVIPQSPYQRTIIIRNANLPAAYQNVLRQVHYFPPPQTSSGPLTSLPQTFGLTCRYGTGPIQSSRPADLRSTNHLALRLHSMARRSRSEVVPATPTTPVGGGNGRSESVKEVRRHRKFASAAGLHRDSSAQWGDGYGRGSDDGGPDPIVFFHRDDPLALVRSSNAAASGPDHTRLTGTRASSLYLVGISLVALVAFVAILLIRAGESNPHFRGKRRVRLGNEESLPLRVLSKASKIGGMVRAVRRGKGNNGHRPEENQEMAWDDGALSIVVNPMVQHPECEFFEPDSLQSSIRSGPWGTHGAALVKKEVEVSRTGHHYGPNIYTAKTVEIGPALGRSPHVVPKSSEDSDSDFDGEDDEDGEDGMVDDDGECVTEEDDDIGTTSDVSSGTDRRKDFFFTRDNDFRYIRGGAHRTLSKGLPHTTRSTLAALTGPSPKEHSVCPASAYGPSNFNDNDATALGGNKRYGAGFKHFLTRSVRRIIDGRSGPSLPFPVPTSSKQQATTTRYETCPTDEASSGTSPRHDVTTCKDTDANAHRCGNLEWDDAI